MLGNYLEFDYLCRRPRKVFIQRCYVSRSMPDRGSCPLCWWP